MRRAPFALLSLATAALLTAAPLGAQSLLERTPGTQGTWTLPPGEAAFVLGHRFEVLEDGDETINFPTLTLALGLPLGLTAGLDFTTNAEAVEDELGGNQAAAWLKRAWRLGPLETAAQAGYDAAAESVDAGLGARAEVGPATLLAEARWFQRRFGEDEPGVAGVVGAVLRLNRYLGLSGDLARPFWEDGGETVWSAGVAAAIPGTPHTFSLHATNGGATTPQGAVREKRIGPEDVRWGFVFTVPLGGADRWARILRPPPEAAPAAADSVAATVEIRNVAYGTREVRVRAGESVAWVNRDPLVHSVTADDGSWDSGLLAEGERFVRRFDRPGRYPYHCVPHPQMRAVVVVEP